MARVKNQTGHRENEKRPSCLNPQQKGLRSGHGRGKGLRYFRSTLKNSIPSASLTAWNSRPIYPQCIQKYADAWSRFSRGIWRSNCSGTEKRARNTSLLRHFGSFLLSDRTIVSLGAKFNNPDNPRDKTLHVKGAIFCPLLKGNPPRR